MALFNCFRCQTTKQGYKIIRQEWTAIKLIKVRKNGEVFKNLSSFFGRPYRFYGMKIRQGTALVTAKL